MPAKPPFFIVCRYLLVSALLGIGVLSLLPSPPEPPELISWDKLQHASAYAVLTLLFYAANLARYQFIRDLLLCAVLAWSYGALIEILQWLMPFGRAAEWSDLAANLVGVLLACLLLCLCRFASRAFYHEA